MDILESTRKGLLENIQNRISKPLGAREIKKTKVYTVLWDTLYYQVIQWYSEWSFFSAKEYMFGVKNIV